MNLNNLLDRYINKIGKIQSSEELLEKYNPWHDSALDCLIKSFSDAIEKNDKSFSWLNIDKSSFSKIKGSKYERYGIPNHIHGDIDNSRLFLCLINPNISKAENRRHGITDFYTRENEHNDESLNILDEQKNLKFNEGELKEFIKKHIIFEYSILLQELQTFKGSQSTIKTQKDAYYLTHYFANICMAYLGINEKTKTFADSLSQDNLEKLKTLANEVTNLEAYPFRSAKPNFDFVESTSKVTMLSARIIIWRIVKYLHDLKTDKNVKKPIFMFRRFNDAWLPSIKNVLKYDLNFTDSEIENILSELHKEFFLTIQKKGFKNTTNSVGRSSLYKNDEPLDEKEFNELFKNLFSRN